MAADRHASVLDQLPSENPLVEGYSGFQRRINSSLIGAGVITDPIEALLYNPLSVSIALTHAWAPFALLPIYVSLEKIDRSVLEASNDPW